MIVSNEPGFYKWKIWYQNRKSYKSKRKKGICFDNLTIVPLDKNLIDKKILKFSEIDWINNYHKNVYKKLKIFMNKNELSELKKACSKI